MPIDRSYTDVEKEIIKRLAGTPGLASLYDAVRKDENVCLPKKRNTFKKSNIFSESLVVARSCRVCDA